jgi:AbrB family looped-hinge helix DNA binding protein
MTPAPSRVPVTTKMSSRGQVVIPEQVRQQLRLEPGTEFIVVAKDDVIVLQRVSMPAWKEFDALVAESGRQAHHLNLAMQNMKRAFIKMRNTTK